jgi:hypothetical protein
MGTSVDSVVLAGAVERYNGGWSSLSWRCKSLCWHNDAKIKYGRRVHWPQAIHRRYRLLHLLLRNSQKWVRSPEPNLKVCSRTNRYDHWRCARNGCPTECVRSLRHANAKDLAVGDCCELVIIHIERERHAGIICIGSVYPHCRRALRKGAVSHYYDENANRECPHETLLGFIVQSVVKLMT